MKGEKSMIIAIVLVGIYLYVVCGSVYKKGDDWGWILFLTCIVLSGAVIVFILGLQLADMVTPNTIVK